ncbi:hypothetical protein RQP46_007619 [Phenoliferia psychrophenolica]
MENGRVAFSGAPTESSAGLVERTEVAPVVEDGEPTDPIEEPKSSSRDLPAKLKLVKAEKQLKGNVPVKLYTFYVRVLGGWWLFLVAFGFFTAAQLSEIVRFYDSTPSGRILNRLSSDTGTVDNRLASTQMYLIFDLFSIIGILGTISVVFPAFLAPAALISLFYMGIGYLCSVARSPVFSLFGEALNGIVTLRAYGDTFRFLRQSFTLLDTGTRPANMTFLVNRCKSDPALHI